MSKRAHRPRITISNNGLVELVWPYRMSQVGVPSMLTQHQLWVLNHLDRLGSIQPNPITPPFHIVLNAIRQTWSVDYQQQLPKRLKFMEEGCNLTIKSDVESQEDLRKLLCVWVKGKGKAYLKPWLAETAKEMGLSYISVSIRLQKKRWGSCSASKRLNLNASLLFLPDFLVRHVLIHELAHLKHLNHSPAFWAEVKKYDANYAEHRKLLHKYAADVPVWLTEPFTK